MKKTISETRSIYDIIRKFGPVARGNIAKNFQKRPATVTRITNKLLNQNLVCACGKEQQKKGRSMELLKVNPDAFFVLGIHAVRNGFRGSIVSAGGKVIFYSTLSLRHKHTRNGFLSGLRQAVKQYLDRASLNGIEVSGIGLAMPGEVDHQNGSLTKAAIIFPELTDVPCKEFLEKEFKLPVTVDHNAAMITQAEFLWGCGKLAQNSMGTLFVGNGIGGRFIVDGKLFRGARNRAGELGHLPVRRNGPKCQCGLTGCLEAMASIPVIEKNYSGNICFSEIVDKAESGEPRAIEVLHQAAQYLGEALAMIFDMLDVDLMVINGDIVAAKNIIQKTLIESVIKNSHSKQPPNKEFIKFSNFGPEVGTVGAAASAVQSIYSAFGVNNN